MERKTRLNTTPAREAANATFRRKETSGTASFADNSSWASHQTNLINNIQTSSSTISQAAQLKSIFGPTAQLAGEEDEQLQMKAEPAPAAAVQLAAEDEEQMQMKAESTSAAVQLAGEEDEQLQMKAESSAAEPASSASNDSRDGGLPSGLQEGIEQASGMDMSDVRVHSNSSQPADIHAYAFTQGNDIHLGPGQEQHLPHEAWHVVQQRQGRVAPTFQAKGMNINDDAGLEHEADVMGAQAAQTAQAKAADPDFM